MLIPKQLVAVTAASLVLALVVPTASTAASACRGRRATIVGTPGADQLNGTARRDVIAALGGDDVIFSLGGNDLVCTGAGADEAYGAGGSDVLLGQAGGDTLVGGAGNDKIAAAGGDDYLNGGGGDDSLEAGSGFDQVDFNTSTQPVEVDLTRQKATGEGTDVVRGAEMVRGSNFDDRLTGSDEAFELFWGLAGNDHIDGRGGVDQLVFNEATAPITADAAAGTASGEGEDTFASIESFVGSSFGDTLLGAEGQDDIYGYDGDDIIDGRAGNDYLLGHAGNDDITGGPGVFDMLDFEDDAPQLTIDIPAGTSTGEGNDTISELEIIGGSLLDDTMIGGSEDELFYPYGGDDSVDGGGGEDFVLYDVAPAPITADLAQGIANGDGTDTLTRVEGLVGSSYDDSLTGDSNSNSLIGGPGNDTLVGGDDNDYLDGGAGSDNIDGGPGTFDMIDYFAAPRRVVADLEAHTATGFGSDSLMGIEAVLGSAFADELSGDAGPNYLEGRDGNDQLVGRDGDDSLDGGPGSNTLNGGVGTDDCFAGTPLQCEGEEQTKPRQVEMAERVQELYERLEDLQARTG